MRRRRITIFSIFYEMCCMLHRPGRSTGLLHSAALARRFLGGCGLHASYAQLPHATTSSLIPAGRQMGPSWPPLPAGGPAPPWARYRCPPAATPMPAAAAEVPAGGVGASLPLPAGRQNPGLHATAASMQAGGGWGQQPALRPPCLAARHHTRDVAPHTSSARGMSSPMGLPRTLLLLHDRPRRSAAAIAHQVSQPHFHQPSASTRRLLRGCAAAQACQRCHGVQGCGRRGRAAACRRRRIQAHQQVQVAAASRCRRRRRRLSLHAAQQVWGSRRRPGRGRGLGRGAGCAAASQPWAGRGGAAAAAAKQRSCQALLLGIHRGRRRGGRRRGARPCCCC